MSAGKKSPNYRPRKVIAVDVDGTLHRGGIPNEKLIEWCRAQKAAGFTLLLWSAAGEDHARHVAEKFGVGELFSHILAKPGYVLDDQGWDWIRYTRVIRDLECVYPSPD